MFAILLTILIFFFCLALTLGAPAKKNAQNSTIMELKQARKFTETALRIYELQRFKEATAQLKSEGYSLKGFYHTSTWRDQWKLIVQEQLRLMDGKRHQAASAYDYDTSRSSKIDWGAKNWASVLEASDELHLTVAGKIADIFPVTNAVDELNLRGRHKIKIHFNETIARASFRMMNDSEKEAFRQRTKLSEGEVATFEAMREYCVRERKSGRKAFVYYLHNKGGCCSRSSEPSLHVTTWRDAMNAFNIEFPSICLRSLLDGYSACGMELQDGTFSGNYMWANCNHVALLPQVTDTMSPLALDLTISGHMMTVSYCLLLLLKSFLLTPNACLRARVFACLCVRAQLWNPFDAYAVEYAMFNISKHHHHAVQFGETCGYASHNFGFNHYEFPSPRSSYLGRLMELVMQPELPPSDVLKFGNAYQNLDLHFRYKAAKKDQLKKCAEVESDPTPFFKRKGSKLGAHKPFNFF